MEMIVRKVNHLNADSLITTLTRLSFAREQITTVFSIPKPLKLSILLQINEAGKIDCYVSCDSDINNDEFFERMDISQPIVHNVNDQLVPIQRMLLHEPMEILGHFEPISEPFRLESTIDHLLGASAGSYVLLEIRNANPNMFGNSLLRADVNGRYTDASTCYQLSLFASDKQLASKLATDLTNSGAAFSVDQHVYASILVSPSVFNHSETNSLLHSVGSSISELLGYSPFADSENISRLAANSALQYDWVVGENTGHNIGFQDLASFRQGIGIVGDQGSGKTTLIKTAIEALHEKNAAIVVIAPVKTDFSGIPYAKVYRAGAYRHTDPRISPLMISITDLPKDDMASVDLAMGALAMISPQSNDGFLPIVYRSALTSLFASDREISLSDIAEESKSSFRRSGYTSMKEAPSTLQAIMNRPMDAATHEALNVGHSNFKILEMVCPGACTVFELEAMSTQERIIASMIILQQLLNHLKHLPYSSSGVSVALIVDEYHELAQPDFTKLIYNYNNTCRARAGALIVADQSADQLGPLMCESIRSHIILRQTNAENESIRTALALPPESNLLAWLPYMENGEGLLHVEKFKTVPFRMNFEETYQRLNQVKQNVPIQVIQTSYVPFQSCNCRTCNYQLHNLIAKAVRFIINTDSIDRYREELKQAAALTNKDERQAKRKAAYEQLLYECIREACVRIKSPSSEIDAAQVKLSTIRACGNNELRRQLAFTLYN